MGGRAAIVAVAMGLMTGVMGAQGGSVGAGPGTGTTPTGATPPRELYTPTPSFDLSSIDKTADPCNDFYKFACGKYAANHPIPADQAGADGFYTLFNVNTQQLSGILEKAEAGGAGRTPDEQKIGDYYHACMDEAEIERRGLEPLEPMLKQIDSMSLFGLARVVGELQREGVTVFFSFGEQQDFKDATEQIATIDQGGLGMPEKDYYLRSGAKDEELRKDYVAYMTKMLALGGSSPQQALKDANAIMAFETGLAKASMGVTERRDPEKVYHLVPASEVAKQFPLGMFGQFEEAVHAPHVNELNDANPSYLPAMIALVKGTEIGTLRAYYAAASAAGVRGRAAEAVR